ncbi:hypothetical protein [Ruegeria alba]|uniref:hypothetical protein n=1 Tax=Ruegeria alba TaxID=2916756 RepID=UPI001EEF6541
MIGGVVAWIAGSAAGQATLRYAVTALAILMFLLALRRSGERAGRMAEKLEAMEKAHEIQRRMLQAAARRPRDHHELAERLRGGRF